MYTTDSACSLVFRCDHVVLPQKPVALTDVSCLFLECKAYLLHCIYRECACRCYSKHACGSAAVLIKMTQLLDQDYLNKPAHNTAAVPDFVRAEELVECLNHEVDVCCATQSACSIPTPSMHLSADTSLLVMRWACSQQLACYSFAHAVRSTQCLTPEHVWAMADERAKLHCCCLVCNQQHGCTDDV